ncbi:TPA: hypothetical protein HA241_03115 [Candidatus Woesearchaeota archaeon]|nr:hypothetical protein [Candidatus Woesearchaeota archaeon]
MRFTIEKGMALFMLTLIFTLPFYSADVLAVSVRVTHNSGQANIDSFLDAESDTWTVDVDVLDSPDENIDPNSVRVKIGNNEESFNACQQTDTGHSCTYINPLTTGIEEREYPFEVLYRFLNAFGVAQEVSAADTINADGSGPTVRVSRAIQSGVDGLQLQFTATDKIQGKPSVGLQRIEIIDAATNTILYTIPEEEINLDPFVFNEQIPFISTGEGTRHLKIQAVDKLGHVTRNPPVVAVRTDFVAPEFQTQSLNFTALGDYIGTGEVPTDILLDVLETSDLREVVASSNQAELDNEPQTECLEDTEQVGLWHCRWENINVGPGPVIDIEFTAVDEFGNTVTTVLSKSFIEDSFAPEIVSFGTLRQFEGGSNVRPGENTFVLKVREQGIGMDKNGVRLNLAALGGGDGHAPPTYCEQQETFNCYWDIDVATARDNALVNLAVLEDRVGNEGELRELDVAVDQQAPSINTIEFFGVSVVGDNDFFQSGDQLKIKLNVTEKHGLTVLLDARSLIMDARIKYPAHALDRNLPPDEGWVVFTEEQCEQIDQDWICSLVTDPIRSGYLPAVPFVLRVQDTAGNIVERWEAEPKHIKNGNAGSYAIEILAVDGQENPDHWQLSRDYPQAQLDFIDLDTVSLIPTRMPLTLKLETDTPQASVVRMDLGSCSPEVDVQAPPLQRALLYGGASADGETSPKATLVLEFEPFNPTEVFAIPADVEFQSIDVSYQCQLRLFSKIGTGALEQAEFQLINVTVPFAFSTIGALDESLGKKVKDIQKSWLVEWAERTATVEKVLDWIKYVSNVLQIILSLYTIWDLTSDTLVVDATAAKKIPVTTAVGAAMNGQCLLLQTGQQPGFKFAEYAQVPLQLLNCDPSLIESGAGSDILGWYGKWQRFVLDSYNIASGRGVLGVPADSLYENIYTSTFGICLPGVIYNLKKAREIHCRRVICYGREVPLGIATTQSCDQLNSLLMCEYFYGPLVDLTPLGGLKQLSSILRAAFTSPVGLFITVGQFAACLPLCLAEVPPAPAGALTSCKIATGFGHGFDIIESIISSVNQRPDLTGTPYCDAAEKIDFDNLASVEQPDVPEAEA